MSDDYARPRSGWTTNPVTGRPVRIEVEDDLVTVYGADGRVITQSVYVSGDEPELDPLTELRDAYRAERAAAQVHNETMSQATFDAWGAAANVFKEACERLLG